MPHPSQQARNRLAVSGPLRGPVERMDVVGQSFCTYLRTQVPSSLCRLAGVQACRLAGLQGAAHDERGGTASPLHRTQTTTSTRDKVN